jgi:hypothetical protein
VALSSAKAEYIAATEAVKEALWLKRFLNDVDLPNLHINPVPIWVDNMSAIELAHNPEHHNRTKHIDARHYFIRDAVEAGEVNIKWISTEHNVAYVLIKALGRFPFECHRTRMGLWVRLRGAACPLSVPSTLYKNLGHHLSLLLVLHSLAPFEKCSSVGFQQHLSYVQSVYLPNTVTLACYDNAPLYLARTHCLYRQSRSLYRSASNSSHISSH